MKIYGDMHKAVEEANRIFEEIDNNLSGKVDYSEFLTAMMNNEKMLNKKRIEQEFRIFDKDGNGFIDKKELETIMGEIKENVSAW